MSEEESDKREESSRNEDSQGEVSPRESEDIEDKRETKAAKAFGNSSDRLIEIKDEGDREVKKSRGSRDKRSRSKDRKSRSRDKKSHSRSRSPHRMSGRSRYRSRSRSPRRRRRSRSGSGSPRRRSGSHSPMSSRRRHNGNREDPLPNRCLGVFGLSVRTTEDELVNYFSKFGPVERMQVVIDAKTGRSRGFAFCYYQSVEDAKIAKEQCSGMEFDGRRIRVDYSITQRAHTPTPGIYMGKPTYMDRDRDRDYGRGGGGSYGGYRDRGYRDDDYGYGGYRDRGFRRSPSPYYRSRRRYDRSRSRSYSPRRY